MRTGGSRTVCAVPRVHETELHTMTVWIAHLMGTEPSYGPSACARETPTRTTAARRTAFTTRPPLASRDAACGAVIAGDPQRATGDHHPITEDDGEVLDLCRSRATRRPIRPTSHGNA